jgi:hypothetical protein
MACLVPIQRNDPVCCWTYYSKCEVSDHSHGQVYANRHRDAALRCREGERGGARLNTLIRTHGSVIRGTAASTAATSARSTGSRENVCNFVRLGRLLLVASKALVTFR